MKKLSKNKINKTKEKLKHFWKKHRNLEAKFRKAEIKLEKEMNRRINA